MHLVRTDEDAIRALRRGIFRGRLILSPESLNCLVNLDVFNRVLSAHFLRIATGVAAIDALASTMYECYKQHTVFSYPGMRDDLALYLRWYQTWWYTRQEEGDLFNRRVRRVRRVRQEEGDLFNRHVRQRLN